MIRKNYDVIIIGGGFFGTNLAIFLKKYFSDILLIEAEKDLLTRASSNNQARIHNGYHYPRSFLTARRSHLNLGSFLFDFKPAVIDNFDHLYAIAKFNSKVTGLQFEKFCKEAGLPFLPSKKNHRQLFNLNLIDQIYQVQEPVFSVKNIRKIILNRLKKSKIKLLFSTKALSIKKTKQGLVVETKTKNFQAKMVFLCAYSGINQFLENSNLETIPLKYEFTELALVKPPPEISKLGITVMDGPFFSFLPFPDRKLHTLSHVRYTPHLWWTQAQKKHSQTKSNYIYMVRDAERFVPKLNQLKYQDSLYEIKTLLQENEIDDGRPILFRPNYGLENFSIILGGKIDNIYDILIVVDKLIKG